MQDQNHPEETNAGAPPPEAPGVPAGSALRSAMSWIRDLAFSVVIAVILIVFIYQPVKVEGTSMMPALKDQERIFINKFVYRFGLGDIHRGDTVVFKYPVAPEKSYIKRVIAVPGDRVRIEAGQVFVNDRPLSEEYVTEHDAASWPSAPQPLADRVVPADRFFVLGDNRSSSSDSRAWGFVPRRNIYGKAVFAYWPLEQIGPVK
jgi:signal peptidase I